MPQCPHCQTEYEKGQRYCSVCGSFLLHPEEGDTFCPQCGVRVSPRQEFCHECDAPLKGEALKVVKPVSEETPPREAPPPRPGPTPVLSSKGLPPWVLGLIGVLGIIIIILLIIVFSRTGPPPAPPAPGPQAQAPAPPTPAPTTPAPTTPAPTAPAPTAPAPAPAADLKDVLQNVLSGLRDAQLKKNINEFMTIYSESFPDYEQKRKDTLEAWKHYDYTNLVFTVDKVQTIDDNNVMAWVTWYLDIKNRDTQEVASAAQTFRVRFVKEGGNWRIRELKEVQ